MAQRIEDERSRYGRPLTEIASPPSRSAGRTVHFDKYVFEDAPEHPRANRWGFVPQHRLVAEHYLGRHLLRKEVVHHEDRNKTNNDPSNLWVFESQSAHLSHHHESSYLYLRKDFSKLVLPYAEDPGVTMAQAAKALGLKDLQSIVRICKKHSIPWIASRKKALDEESVREALQGRTTLEAADLLGVNHQTLRNRFPHLIKKRASPKSLDLLREEIRSLATHKRSKEIASIYMVHHQTVDAAIHRWEAEEPDAWKDVRAFQSSRLGIRWSKKRMAEHRNPQRQPPSEDPPSSTRTHRKKPAR